MVFYEGVPQPARVLSSATSSQATSYTLVFTVESFRPLREVKIRVWPQVGELVEITIVTRSK